jgi:hypothetical protein
MLYKNYLLEDTNFCKGLFVIETQLSVNRILVFLFSKVYFKMWFEIHIFCV